MGCGRLEPTLLHGREAGYTWIIEYFFYTLDLQEMTVNCSLLHLFTLDSQFHLNVCVFGQREKTREKPC